MISSIVKEDDPLASPPAFQLPHDLLNSIKLSAPSPSLITIPELRLLPLKLNPKLDLEPASLEEIPSVELRASVKLYTRGPNMCCLLVGAVANEMSDLLNILSDCLVIEVVEVVFWVDAEDGDCDVFAEVFDGDEDADGDGGKVYVAGCGEKKKSSDS
ncbi:unnamed protein product [Ambrosiozyma monospora]|uniref:Unnamed protein product n=1 Tax=Ambrosiozyma monospora TaxID=43982 RepID=A0ACB5TK38_AMBMO|nr:unnamed protein product [Ambrosiozyma monospora]